MFDEYEAQVLIMNSKNKPGLRQVAKCFGRYVEAVVRQMAFRMYTPHIQMDQMRVEARQGDGLEINSQPLSPVTVLGMEKIEVWTK
ncbi:hypothetical protein FOPG_18292 [Fusarium oxysporum f. sp. conglutinans race 2 54008]|uniref:Uncharacterized protein n=1 Tax=Fusarium oxysporum f. sp. conglutinans race 2 54008 TaxID=1089457 RepID=X0GPE9_FUSOX|nr:hypothetical protein FOPG_18292 [Fusarium oxysporum f. sp. conglutinans race 2 54008]